MSTIKELGETKTTVMIRPKEDFLLSLSRSLVTFGFLALCIYISKGSNFWTLVTGMMFIAFLWMNLVITLKTNSNTFSDHKSAIEYLKKLDD